MVFGDFLISVSWSLTRSLRDLNLLSNLLSKIYPSIPQFPSTSGSKSKLEIQTVLNFYLQHSFIINSLKFRLFFDLGKHYPVNASLHSNFIKQIT